MGLKEDARKIFTDLFGPAVASQLDGFDDPARYPKEFLSDCAHFMEQLIGKEAAGRNLEPLYRKYIKQKKQAK